MEKQMPGIYLHIGELKKIMRTLPEEMARDAVWAFLKYEIEGIEPDKTDYIAMLAFENLRELQERNEERYAARCEKAKEASMKRWDKRTDANGMRTDTDGMPTDKEAIPAMQNENVNVNEKENESPLRENARARADEAAEQQTLSDFERFWSAYPKKTRRPYALDAFRAAVRKVDISLIMKGLERMKRSRDWKEEEGRFIPTPERWLREERWYDEPVKLKEKDPLRVIRWEDLL